MQKIVFFQMDPVHTLTYYFLKNYFHISFDFYNFKRTILYNSKACSLHCITINMTDQSKLILKYPARWKTAAGDCPKVYLTHTQFSLMQLLTHLKN